jgi:molybdate transport system substrate-binding protein
MKRFAILFFLLMFAPLVHAAEVAKPTAPSNLTIIVDEQMLLPLATLARAYATSTSTPLNIVLKNAEDTEHQIGQGLEAHVIITADYPLITRLVEQGLTDVTSRRPIARTPLALVTANPLSKKALIAKRISFAAMLYATPDLPVYINAPETLDGGSAAQLLSGHDFSTNLAARIQIKTNDEELIETLRDSEALGLILAADAVAEKDLTVLALLPNEVSNAVTFDAVVLGSESMNAAKTFASYLHSRAAQQVFARFGFQSPSN